MGCLYSLQMTPQSSTQPPAEAGDVFRSVGAPFCYPQWRPLVSRAIVGGGEGDDLGFILPPGPAIAPLKLKLSPPG